jgi:hypothetical protein
MAGAVTVQLCAHACICHAPFVQLLLVAVGVYPSAQFTLHELPDAAGPVQLPASAAFDGSEGAEQPTPQLWRVKTPFEQEVAVPVRV